MIIAKSPDYQSKTIDLTGPEGNAYNILSIAEDLYKQLEKTPEEIDDLLADMMSSDYNHLVAVFEVNFGEFFSIIVPESLKEGIRIEIDNINKKLKALNYASKPLGEVSDLELDDIYK